VLSMSYASGSSYPSCLSDTLPLPGKGRTVENGFGGMTCEEHTKVRYYAFMACFLTSIAVRWYVMFSWIWARTEIDWWGESIPEYAGLSTQTIAAASNWLNSLLMMVLVVSFVSCGHYNVYKDWNMFSFFWNFYGPATGLSFYMMINPVTPGPEIWATFLYKIILSFGVIIGGMSLYSVVTIADTDAILAQMTATTPALANTCDVFMQMAVVLVYITMRRAGALPSLITLTIAPFCPAAAIAFSQLYASPQKYIDL